MEANPWFCTSTTMSLTRSGDGGDELLRHHQVGAVTDHDEDVPVGAGHLCSEPTGDLVAHAGVPVLDVVTLGVAGAP